MSEKDLIRRCKKGDRSAFDELFEKYQAQIINIAYGMLSNQEDAYDAAQEVFVRVYKSIDMFKEQSSFTTWLYRVTANICSDMLRKRQRQTNTVSLNQSFENKDVDIRDESPTPEENYELTERQAAVRAAIGELKDEYRIVITLCDLEGMSYESIAEILKVPTGTIKSRINRARAALKKILANKRELF